MLRFPLLVSIFSGILNLTFAASVEALKEPDRGVPELRQGGGGAVSQEAQGRLKEVALGMLPHVVFDGESKPESIESRMALYNTPALSVAVIHHGKLEWSAAWGQLQKGGTAAEIDTLFQAGSIAKPVTLLAALRLRTAGLIDFDQDIETYLSSYHLPAGRQTKEYPVTIRQLLAHRAGITPGGYAGYPQNAPLPTDQQIVRGEAPSNSRKVEVVTPPGASLSYSGGGYTLIEIALQDHLHLPFDQLLREWLLDPVGMTHSEFTVPLPTARRPQTARGHLADGSLVPGGWNNYPEQAAAGLWATATDLALLLIEIRKGYEGTSRVFTQSDILEMLAKPIDGHVYGFRLMGDGEEVFITHYGGTVGYRAGMTLNVRTGDGAVFLANSDDGANLGDEFFSAVARVYEWPTFRNEKVTRLSQSPAMLKSLAGTYLFSEQGWSVSVVYENEALTLVFPKGDRPSLPLVPIQGKPHAFVHETGVHVSFEGEGNDMTIHLYGQTGKRQESTH